MSPSPLGAPHPPGSVQGDSEAPSLNGRNNMKRQKLLDVPDQVPLWSAGVPTAACEGDFPEEHQASLSPTCPGDPLLWLFPH